MLLEPFTVRLFTLGSLKILRIFRTLQVRSDLNYFTITKKPEFFFFFFFLEPCSPTLLSYSVERPNTDNNTVHPGKTEMQLPMESLSVFYKGGWMGSGGRRGKRRNYIVSLWL